MKLILLAVCLGLSAALPAVYVDEVDIAFSHIRDYFNTKQGITTARDFVRRFDDGHPVLFMVKTFFSSASDDLLQKLMTELLKDIPQVEADPNVDIHEVFIKAHYFLISEAGPAVVKAYFQNLQTDNPIAQRVRDLFVGAGEAELREVLEAILPPFFYADDVRTELRSLFHQIRTILITPEGIEAVREFARTVQPTHPALFLIKGFIVSADDKVLLEILDEVFKNFGGPGYESASEQLERLFLRVRELLQTDEGFSVIKSFLLNIKSDHAIVSRVHAFISQASDQTLREILDALFGDLF